MHLEAKGTHLVSMAQKRDGEWLENLTDNLKQRRLTSWDENELIFYAPDDHISLNCPPSMRPNETSSTSPPTCSFLVAMEVPLQRWFSCLVFLCVCFKLQFSTSCGGCEIILPSETVILLYISLHYYGSFIYHSKIWILPKWSSTLLYMTAMSADFLH